MSEPELPPGRSGRSCTLPLLASAALGLMAALGSLDAPLRTEAAPHGIVSFELAGELARARAIVESWGPHARLHAAFSLGLDYLFLVAYSAAIAFGCLFVARRLAPQHPLRAAGLALALAQPLAAVLDAVENFALWRVLLGTERELWPALAWWCAVPKFGLVALGLLYFLLGGVLALVLRRRARD